MVQFGKQTKTSKIPLLSKKWEAGDNVGLAVELASKYSYCGVHCPAIVVGK
jgi:hypothetical protein